MFQFLVWFFASSWFRTHGKITPGNFRPNGHEKKTPWICSTQLLTELEDVFPNSPQKTSPPFFFTGWKLAFIKPQNVLLLLGLVNTAVHPKKGLGTALIFATSENNMWLENVKNISLKFLKTGDLHHPRTYDRKQTITPNTKTKSKPRWVSVSPLYPPTGGLSNRFLLHPMPTWDLLHPASQKTCTNLLDQQVGRYGFTTCGMKYRAIPC